MDQSLKNFWIGFGPIISYHSVKHGMRVEDVIASVASANRYQGIGRREDMCIELFDKNWAMYGQFKNPATLLSLLVFAEKNGIEEGKRRILEQNTKKKKPKQKNQELEAKRENRVELLESIASFGYETPQTIHKIDNQLKILQLTLDLCEKYEKSEKNTELLNKKLRKMQLDHLENCDVAELENLEHSELSDCELASMEKDLQELIDREQSKDSGSDSDASLENTNSGL